MFLNVSLQAVAYDSFILVVSLSAGTEGGSLTLPVAHPVTDYIFSHHQSLVPPIPAAVRLYHSLSGILLCVCVCGVYVCVCA